MDSKKTSAISKMFTSIKQTVKPAATPITVKTSRSKQTSAKVTIEYVNQQIKDHIQPPGDGNDGAIDKTTITFALYLLHRYFTTNPAELIQLKKTPTEWFFKNITTENILKIVRDSKNIFMSDETNIYSLNNIHKSETDKNNLLFNRFFIINIMSKRRFEHLINHESYDPAEFYLIEFIQNCIKIDLNVQFNKIYTGVGGKQNTKKVAKKV